jgi:DnaK suppressor protein
MPTSTARAARLPKKEVERYRRLLEAKKSSLSAELAKTRTAEEETTEELTQDIADKAVSSYTREFLYSLNDTERNTLILIDQALARIEEGTFGFCQNCGAPMNEKRLDAVPWAPHCIDCQELAEKGLLEN